MKAQIESIGASVISHHSANVKYLITADFSYNQMPEENREKFVRSVRAIGNYQVTAFGHPMTKIKKGKEFYDPCFHLEMPTYFDLTGIEVGEKLVVK
jgi:hypothetical protein